MRTALAFLSIVLAFSQARGGYVLTDLGQNVYPRQINGSGQITGVIQVDAVGDTHAFLYDQSGLHDLGTLGGIYSYGFSINDSGEITGWSQTSDQVHAHAYLYSGGVMHDIGTMGGGPSSNAYGINDAGTIVGGAVATDGHYHAFAYANGRMTDIGSVFGGDTFAQSINSAADITGYGGPDEGEKGFLFHGSRMTTFQVNGFRTLPQAINDAGVVAGWAENGSSFYAFTWKDGTINILPSLTGKGDFAHSINSAGDVVGEGLLRNGGGDAILYHDGTTVDLNRFLPAGSGWTLDGALSINDTGQIVGVGEYEGHNHGFLLTSSQAVTPEPSTIVLMIFGSLFIAGCAWIKRR
jgi:probable HAF family extracellular repeat protein